MPRKRRRKNIRGRRKLKVVLLAVGCIGAVIGLSLALGVPFAANEAQQRFGLFYLGLSIGILLLRQVMSIVDERKKRRQEGL